jgi:eukaryotic-like serine/threonine-protein kinase
VDVNSKTDVRIVGRYALYGVIAAGGMATVHFGRLLGPVGFSRTVAIKRLHAHFASDPEFVSMFLDEARLAARVRHPNVIPTLDVVATEGELFLVMEYVPGETLAKLVKNARDQNRQIPHRMMSAMMVGMLHGLHAAHEAKDERGMPLGIVHRDVSPQNLHIGTDGVPRVLDFGVAKAAGRIQTTREGQIKGKLAYMPPEQLRGGTIGRQCDIYSAGVMLWELVTGTRLFTGDNEGVVVTKVLEGKIEAPSSVVMRLQRATLSEKSIEQMKRLDACVLKAVHHDPAQRFATAKEMARELEACIGPATTSQIAEWVERTAPEVLLMRAEQVAEIESADATPADAIKASEHALIAAHGMAEANARGVLSESRPRPPAADPNNTLSQPSTIAVGSSANAYPTNPRAMAPTRMYVGIFAILALFALFALVFVVQTNKTSTGSITGAGTVTVPATSEAVPPGRTQNSGRETDPTNAGGLGSALTTATPTATPSGAPSASTDTPLVPTAIKTAVWRPPPSTPGVTPTAKPPAQPPGGQKTCIDVGYMDGTIKKYRQECH